jgi:hypothetical protein
MEMFDKDLQGVMGNMYHDDTVPQQMPKVERKAEPKGDTESCTVADKKERNIFDKLYDMTKWLLICGSISMLMWWFEINGLMATEAAYPCILGSSIIGAAGCGWSAK